MSEKTYVPKCNAKSRTSPIVGEVICLDFNVEAMIEFLTKHQNERGYIKLDICRRKTPDERSTHSVTLNDWKPDPNRQAPAPKPTGYSGQKPVDDDDQVPF